MSRIPTARGKRVAQSSAGRRFWEMPSAELEQATEAFDKEFVAETFADPNPAQRKQLVRCLNPTDDEVERGWTLA